MLVCGRGTTCGEEEGKRPAEKRVGTLNKKNVLRARVEATAGGGSGL